MKALELYLHLASILPHLLWALLFFLNRAAKYRRILPVILKTSEEVLEARKAALQLQAETGHISRSKEDISRKPS